MQAERETPPSLDDLITSDPEILGGRRVFRGTRVPVEVLFENLDDALRRRGIDADRFEPTWVGLKTWVALKNGALIRCIEAAGYAVLVTNDKNTAF